MRLDALLGAASLDVSPRGVTPRLPPELVAALAELGPGDLPTLQERLDAARDITAAFVLVRAIVGLGGTPAIPARWAGETPGRRELLLYAGV